MTDLALRVPKSVRVNRRTYDTVGEHNAIAAARGVVAFAKFGSPLSETVLKELNGAKNSPFSRLIIVYRRDDEFYGFGARIKSAIRPTEAEQSPTVLYPSYYDALINEGLVAPPKSYFVLSTPLDPIDLHRFALNSNGRPLLSVLRECRTSTMLITDKS